MKVSLTIFLLPFLALLTLPTDGAAAPVSFSKQIAPILADQCLECHRAEKAKGSYRLDTFEGLMKTGDSEEPPVVPGKPEASFLHELLITADDADRMPKKADPLPPNDLALIKQWISEGAKFDGPDLKAQLTTLLTQERPLAPAKYPRPIPITAMALNGDGKVLATSGYHEVLTWDPETGKARGRVGDLPERILGLSFIAGGPWLAVAGGTPGRNGEVWLVNLANAAERKRLAQMRDCALCAVSTPDGKFLVTGGADNRVRCFSLPEGKPLWNIEMHADWVLALAVSPDGNHVATAGRDRTARVIETATGIIDGTFTAHSVPILSIAFSPDGKEVISGAADGETRRWGLDGTGIKESTVRAGGRSEVLAVAYLDPQTPLAASGNGQVNAIDNKARKSRLRLTNHVDRVNAVLVRGSGETQTLITGSHDGEVRVIQATDAREVLKFIASPGW